MQPKILLVEDDDTAVEMVRRTFVAEKLDHEIVHAVDGVEALEILRGTETRKALPAPAIVLLDLMMPRMTGFEFLKELSKDDALRDTLVFVLTDSDSPTDRVQAFEYAVEGYVVKSRAGKELEPLLTILRG